MLNDDDKTHDRAFDPKERAHALEFLLRPLPPAPTLRVSREQAELGIRQRREQVMGAYAFLTTSERKEADAWLQEAEHRALEVSNGR